MRIRAVPVACVIMLLTGCGLADQYSVMPKILRQPSTEPRPPAPEPDAGELVRVAANTLFTAPPHTVAVSRPRRVTDQEFSVCVKAVVPSLIDSQPRPVTLLVMIENGRLTDRHRAGVNDGCENETYEKVNLHAAK